MQNEPMYMSPLEMATVYQKYTPIVLDLFNYLNGRINPLNICTPLIGGFSVDNYAQFQYPNRMCIFLGSIIENFYDKNDSDQDNIDIIMSVVALCLSHELYHANQNIDAHRYKNDDQYMKNIEDSTEYLAEKFCIDNTEMFKLKFGFNYLCRQDLGPLSSATYDSIQDTDMINVLRNYMLGVFRSMQVSNDIVRILSSKDHKNFSVVLYYKDQFVSKFRILENGKYVFNFQEAGEAISKIIVPGSTAAYIFEMRCLEETYGNVYYYLLNIKSYTYDAIMF